MTLGAYQGHGKGKSMQWYLTTSYYFATKQVVKQQNTQHFWEMKNRSIERCQWQNSCSSFLEYTMHGKHTFWCPCHSGLAICVQLEVILNKRFGLEVVSLNERAGMIKYDVKLCNHYVSLEELRGSPKYSVEKVLFSTT